MHLLTSVASGLLVLQELCLGFRLQGQQQLPQQQPVREALRPRFLLLDLQPSEVLGVVLLAQASLSMLKSDCGACRQRQQRGMGKRRQS